MEDIRYCIDRIQLSNSGELYIAGWVVAEQEYELNLKLGNYEERLSNNNVKREDVQSSLKLDTEWVGFEYRKKMPDLEWESLTLECIYKDKVIVLANFTLQEITQEEQLITYNIDSIQKENRGLIISGWAFDYEGKPISLDVEGANKVKLQSNIRPDVKLAYKDIVKDAKVGFKIHLEEYTNTIQLKYKSGKYQLTKIIDLKEWATQCRKQRIKQFLKRTETFFLEAKEKGIKGAIDIRVQEHKEKTLCNYENWLVKHLPTQGQLEEQKKEKFEYAPKISIVVPIYNTPENFLIEMIESIREQTYTNWELCMADGKSKDQNTIRIIKQYAEQDERIKVKLLDDNYGISGNTNECLEMATGEYIGLFDHDDLLTPNALYEMVKLLNEDKSIDFIYSDEDKTDETGKKFFEPHFKPDWSPDTLRSYNYICHFSIFRRKLLDKVGLFRKEYDGSQDHDMILRLTEQTDNIRHIPKILYHWRVHKNSTAGGIGVKRYALESGVKAVQDHLKREGLEGKVSDGLFLGSYRVKYCLKDNPKISILIPNKDHVEDLEKCINSILEKTTYSNYEIIIIENNSVTKEIELYYKELEKNSNIKIVRWEKDFNYAAINNYGAEFATGEYLVLLNNDVEIITEDWAEEMLMYVQREDVGIVGAKLYYPDDTVQHAGVVVGILGVAGHVHKGKVKQDPSYFGRSQIVQNLSAVTAAFLMIRKDIFEQVEGLDEKFKVAFNDIDLCMKVREKDKLVIFTPYAEAYHYESKSRGIEDSEEKVERFNGEIERFDKKWGLYSRDPYYNENLSLEKEDFSLRVK